MLDDKFEDEVVAKTLPARFNQTAVMPISCVTARIVVMLDGAPYAGFVDKKHAQEAVDGWRERWLACRGASLRVVEV
jgi:hypothetical protein